MILTLFLIMLLVFLTSFLLTSYLCSTSTSPVFLDHPNERSLHSKPTPHTGGIGILGGLFLGTLLVATIHARGVLRGDHGQLIWLLVITGALATLSFWDDWTPLPAVFRLAIQFILASLFLRMTSLVIDSVSIPLVGLIHFGRFGIPLTLLFMVWMTNLYNFMDGMDGLAGGMTVLGCSFFSLLALAHGATSVAWMSLFIMASAGGFLIHNFPPARIFMGDVGSTSLGFMIGALMVIGASDDSKVDLWESILIFSPFIADSTLTLMIRLFKGQKFWTSHRHHFYQKIVLMGWRHRKTVLVEYGLMTACGLSALFYSKLEDRGRIALLLSWMVIYVSMALAIGFLEKNSKRNPLL